LRVFSLFVSRPGDPAIHQIIMSILQVNGLSYTHADRTPLFGNISFAVEAGNKVAIIGPNGSGKSTLLRIIAGQLTPDSGSVAITGTVYSVPQHFGQYGGMTIAGALGIEAKLQALQAILAGDLSDRSYQALQDDWEIETRATAALEEWGLSGFELTQSMDTLSGGEKTRVFLSGFSIHRPELVVLDEPTNHLDAAARQKLYDWVVQTPAALVVVSHDRTLLNLLDTMLELGKNGLTAYGGNYEFYKEQRDNRLRALHEQVEDREKSLRAAQKTAREARERKERQDARGKGKMKKEGTPRILMKTIADKAASTAKKLGEVHTGKIETLSGELRTLRETLPEKREIKVKLGDSRLHTGKILVTAEAVNFSYGTTPLWSTPLSFQIRSGERLVIGGPNGSGKTTLLKLIFGQLEPTEGALLRADFDYLYIDQEYSLIDNRLTVYEQLESWNTRKLPEHVLKTELHRFLFPAEMWDKPCGQLSGGEKMKLLFCCLLVSNAAPDLFVLDEPTNNLDIQSLEIVTRSLREFRGTLLVISHDRYFTREIGVDQEIILF